MKTREERQNVWDNTVPVEKSSYLHDGFVQYLNIDNFKHDAGKLTMIDLFCGAGGFAVGASWAGFESVIGIDHFQPAMETWMYNHPNAIGCLGDIKQIEPEFLKKLLEQKGVKKIHLITGGVPCQGFSIANRKHNDNDERNFLFQEYMRFVEAFKPDYIILENVSGLRSTAGGQFEKSIKEAMERLQYKVTIGMLNAADFGVPQIRQRLMFVGVRTGEGFTTPYKFPLGDFAGRYRTVADAISDLPELSSSQSCAQYTRPAITEYQKIMRGEGNITAIKPAKKLYNHAAPNHLPDVIVKIAGTQPGKPMYPKFKQRIRLSNEAPSPTQLAGGIRPQFQFGHPSQPRGLSIRERARIQSFPDSYVFKGGIVQERVQTGNAVPPLMIYHIALVIAQDIRKKEAEKMYRVWYSTESFADYIINHTSLFSHSNIVKNKLYESDANNPTRFHTMPDHIRRILYLDAPDLIVEKDNEPVFTIEMTTEAGTGHNAFQRFARIAASVENGVPAFYIYPEGAIITRRGLRPVWDKINPLIFRALESVMNIYEIPALLYYFPSDIDVYLDSPQLCPNLHRKGLRFETDIVNYPGCPDASSPSMTKMFEAINEILAITDRYGVKPGRARLLGNLTIREQRNYMQNQFVLKANGKQPEDMSPLTAVTKIPTEYLLNYLSQYENASYQIGELLRLREDTAIYQVNARFRGDPYPGALAAIDYLACREGQTFEERRYNLVLIFGELEVDDSERTIRVYNRHGSSIEDFFRDVKNSAKHNLLVKDYSDLHSSEIPRYLMQVRYGSAYSKVKHIRVYSYFADVILFPDGSLWRDG